MCNSGNERSSKLERQCRYYLGTDHYIFKEGRRGAGGGGGVVKKNVQGAPWRNPSKYFVLPVFDF